MKAKQVFFSAKSDKSSSQPTGFLRQLEAHQKHFERLAVLKENTVVNI